MKSFFAWAIIVMMSSALLVFNEVSSLPDNHAAAYQIPVKFENLNFTPSVSSDDIHVITAKFTVDSGIESAGEIEIVVDGRKKLNNRLIIKQGSSDYSVDFLLSYPGEQHLFSATAILSVNGMAADVIHQEFGIGSTALAGSGNPR